jgi:hypothetical protein
MNVLAPFISFTIHRNGDTALVTIAKYTFPVDGRPQREMLEQYETLSRGATASARKSAKKYS